MASNKMDLYPSQHSTLLSALDSEINMCNELITISSTTGQDRVLETWTKFRDRAIAMRELIASAEMITVTVRTTGDK